jgi:hypothetical protein
MSSRRTLRNYSTSSDNSPVRIRTDDALVVIGDVAFVHENEAPPPANAPPAPNDNDDINAQIDDNIDEEESNYEDAEYGSISSDNEQQDNELDNDINSIEVENVVNDNNTRRRRNNDVTVETCRDNIISENTLKTYVGDLIHLFKWAIPTHPNWFTQYGRRSVDEAFLQREGERNFDFRARRLNSMILLIRNAGTNPILHMTRVYASDYMHYLVKVKQKSDNTNFLSPSSYGNKRSALFHLFRVHNRAGYSEEFDENSATCAEDFTVKSSKIVVQATTLVYGRGRSPCRSNYTNRSVVGCWRMVLVMDCLLLRILFSPGTWHVGLVIQPELSSKT